MPHRLSLELELAIFELAAPPLAMNCLHERVEFFIKVSLVHRSLTAWARDRLRDQLLYTYKPRSNEHDRLKMRLEAGFGRDRLWRDLFRKRPSGLEDVGTGSSDQACESVASFAHPENTPPYAGYWRLCAMIANYCQALDTLWIWPSLHILDIRDLPREDDGNFDTRQLVIDQCWPVETSMSDLLLRFDRLETLVITDTEDDDLVSTIVALPTSIRRVHIHRRDVKVGDYRPDAPVVLPHLELFTFELLLPSMGPPADGDPDALAEVQQAIESVVNAPQCTFRYLRSTKSPDDALADVVAELGIGS